jgi:hypothetical protein
MEDHTGGVVAAVASLLAAIGFPGFVVWLIRRGSPDRELIEILRKALDKGRVRENGYCGALDAFITAVDSLENPPPSLLYARARALARMEEAHCQITGGIR